MKTNKTILFLALFVLALVPFATATCDYTAYTDGAADYFGVNNVGINTTVMAANQSFGSYTFFTPRLNFTRNVSEQFYGTNNGSYSYFSWKTPLNFSTSLLVFNGTNLVSATNYSLRNISATQWVLDWKDSKYNATLLTVYFNRTFIKNVDDLVVSPSDIYIGAVTADFLVQSSSSAYGDDRTFQFTAVSPGNLGEFVNNSNWAVGWSYTEKSCVDQGCSAGVNRTIFNVLAGIFMIGMLVFIGFTLYSGADVKTVVGAVVTFLIMIVALVIINGLITTICAS